MRFSRRATLSSIQSTATVIAVHQDIRDTTTDWFYWCFRVRGAAGHTIKVTFTKSNVIGVRGPAMSLDGGKTWRWLGAESVRGQSFTCAVPADAEEVRFSFGMPYLEANLKPSSRTMPAARIWKSANCARPRKAARPSCCAWAG